jgi:hypothetical protein
MKRITVYVDGDARSDLEKTMGGSFINIGQIRFSIECQKEYFLRK